MKAEELLDFRLFMAKLKSKISKALTVAAKYDYIYTEKGEQIQPSELTPEFLIKNQLNLVLTNKEWIK